MKFMDGKSRVSLGRNTMIILTKVHPVPARLLHLLIWFCLAPSGVGIEANPILERPIPEGGGATEVRCAMAILDIDDIDNAEQKFTVNVFLVIKWNDPRLIHDGPGKTKKELDDIWHPNLIFLNRQRMWFSSGRLVEISPNGDVVFRKQFWGDFSQPLDLHNFPFDQQDFTIQVVSSGTDKIDEMKLVVDRDIKSFMTENYSVPDWDVLGFEVDTEPLVIPKVGSASSFKMTFSAKRIANHYLVKVIAPLLLIVLLSQLVFWLSPSEGASQLGVAVTSFLTVIAYHVALSSKLPQISYLTKLDICVFWGTLLVFLAMIEVVITTGLAQRGMEKLALRMDRICRFAFPGFTLLGGIYAIWFF